MVTQVTFPLKTSALSGGQSPFPTFRGCPHSLAHDLLPSIFQASNGGRQAQNLQGRQAWSSVEELTLIFQFKSKGSVLAEFPFPWGSSVFFLGPSMDWVKHMHIMENNLLFLNHKCQPINIWTCLAKYLGTVP